MSVTSDRVGLCCHRRQTLESLDRNAVHQSLSTPSSRVAIARCRTATLDDPSQAMEVLRTLLQPAINAEIRRTMRHFVRDFFRPAADNARRNTTFVNGGVGSDSNRLVEEVCLRAMDAAKLSFSVANLFGPVAGGAVNGSAKMSGSKRKSSPTKCAGAAKRSKCAEEVVRQNNDLILVTKSGKPVRRNGPKWEPKRLSSDTRFILGSKANKALGFGQTRGRLYMKHPELFK